MSPRQLIVIAIAAIAAIGALLLVRGSGSHQVAANAPPVQQVAGEEVLVVTRDVAQGAALTPSDIGVRLFPTASLAPQFIKTASNPSIQAEYVGAVTRRPFASGEPITTGSVQQPDGHGFMAAELTPGFRAVAVEIKADTAAGGYIQPNDHVDVINTATVSDNGGHDATRSSIVLEDVRVLALDDVVQPQTSGDSPTRTTASVAVLELSAEDARTLAEADGQGDISLALRGVEAETVGLRTSHAAGHVIHEAGAVRVTAFGNTVGGGN